MVNRKDLEACEDGRSGPTYTTANQVAIAAAVAKARPAANRTTALAVFLGVHEGASPAFGRGSYQRGGHPAGDRARTAVNPANYPTDSSADGQ